MTHTPTPDSTFEDRLLRAMLEDFDELTQPAAAPRRRTPRRAARFGLAVPALVAAGVAGVLVFDSGSAPRPSVSPKTHATGAGHPAVALTPHQRVLYHLASQTLSQPASSDRYAILAETDTETDFPGVTVQRTSVDDAQTGASITYQTGYGAESPGAPAVLHNGADAQQTAAYYGALPTDPTALYATLLASAKQSWTQSQAQMQAQAAAAGKPVGPTPVPKDTQTPTDSEFVYENATDLLWSPVVGPQLRAALYEVLAQCQDVTVNANATDPAGQPAIEISQSDSYFGDETTYEDPSSGRVLEQVFSQGGVTDTEQYQPVSYSNTVPADPYPNG